MLNTAELRGNEDLHCFKIHCFMRAYYLWGTVLDVRTTKEESHLPSHDLQYGGREISKLFKCNEVNDTLQ